MNDVLPQGYPYDPNHPPGGITVEECTRFPDEDEKVDEFNDIRGDMVPDYLLLSVDNSGSMEWENIWPTQEDYEHFADRIRAIPGCSNVVIAPVPRYFPGPQTPTPVECWVAEMTQMLQETIGD